MDETHWLILIVDDGRPTAARIQHIDGADWIAGPITVDRIDPELDEHEVVIYGDHERDGWEARAGHAFVRGSQVEIYLFGRTSFAEWQEPNEAAARMVRNATEGK